MSISRIEIEFLSDYNYDFIKTLYIGGLFQIYIVKKGNVEYALKRFENFYLVHYVEFDIMARLNNPFVISLHEIIYNPSMVNFTRYARTKRGAGYYMIMEKALSDIGGTGWLPSVVSDEFLVKAIFEMFCGLKYIHECGIVHGDIKPRNILVQGGTIKYADFGLSTYIIEEPKEVKRDYKYTIPYRPPELDNDDYIYFTSDVWALGCTIYEVIMGERMFNAFNEFYLATLHREFKGVDLKEGYIGSERLRAELEIILNDCLILDPRRRPMAKDILQYPLFSGYQCIVQSPQLRPYPIPPEESIEMREYVISNISGEPEVVALAISIFDRYAQANNYNVDYEDGKIILNIAEDLLGMGKLIKISDQYHRIVESLGYKLYTPNIYSVCLNLLTSKNLMIDSVDIIKALLDVDALRRETYVSNSCSRLGEISS